VTQDRPVESFDENAALAELERLRDAIQAARRARQRTSDEFGAFVKGFRTPSEEPQRGAWESISPPPQPADLLPPTVVIPSDTDAFGETTGPTRPPVSHRHRPNIRTLGIGVIIAVIALGLLSNRWRKQTSPPTRVDPVTKNHVSTGHGETPTPAATPLASAHAVVLEMRTVRPVWMRVVVDGQKNVEGTVQGGEPLHFTGDHSIVVRVGNGGDVLVKTGDREGPFGDVGQPLTRTFVKP
jgi:hypothetical protein